MVRKVRILLTTGAEKVVLLAESGCEPTLPDDLLIAKAINNGWSTESLSEVEKSKLSSLAAGELLD